MGEAVEFVLFGLAALVALTAVGSVLLVRGALRRYRRMRSRFVTVLAAGPGRPQLPPVGSASWWLTQRDRRRMWASVTAADGAVARARELYAPVGDLPALCRELRAAATAVDAALRDASPTGRGASVVSRQVSDVVAVASELRAAAVGAVTGVSAPQLRVLADRVALERAALAAGLAGSERVGVRRG